MILSILNLVEEYVIYTYIKANNESDYFTSNYVDLYSIGLLKFIKELIKIFQFLKIKISFVENLSYS